MSGNRAPLLFSPVLVSTLTSSKRNRTIMGDYLYSSIWHTAMHPTCVLREWQGTLRLVRATLSYA